MVALLPPAELQFSDANGQPYAGGTVATCIPGTTTPVSTWSESTGTVLNTNPITLDSAGRCVIYASGAVRTILKDALGNLIWDQLSNTLVSTAMAPVCLAPDIATAQSLLGISSSSAGLAAAAAAQAAETARAEAAEAAEATARVASDAVLSGAINGEQNRALAAEAALAASVAAVGAGLAKGGNSSTDGTGHVRITFAAPYPTACTAVVLTQRSGAGFTTGAFNATVDRFGFDCWSTYPGSSSYAPGANFFWMAYGN